MTVSLPPPLGLMASAERQAVSPAGRVMLQVWAPAAGALVRLAVVRNAGLPESKPCIPQEDALTLPLVPEHAIAPRNRSPLTVEVREMVPLPVAVLLTMPLTSRVPANENA